MRTSARFVLVGAAAVVATTAAVFGAASPASAHVTVHSDEAAPGSFARVEFRVPNESDTASTTQVEVHFPEEAPIPSVSTTAVAGWSVEVAYRSLDEPVEGGHGAPIEEAVESVTWTADDDAAIGPGEFGELPVSLGPLPDVDELVFRVLQTYSDGLISRWIEPPDPDGSEPPDPAPVLELAPSDAAASDDAAPDGDSGSDGDSGADSAAADDGSDDESASRSLGVAALATGLGGLVVGLAGLTLGAVAFVRTRR